MNSLQFKIGDIAIAVSQGVEQTPPLKIVDIQRHDDGLYYYKLDEESATYWSDVKTPPGLLALTLDVNRTHKNKTGYDASPYDFNCSFATETHTTETFLRDVVAQGWPYTMAHAKRAPKETGADARNVKTPKHGENFTSIQIITGDDDRGQAGILDFWRRDPFFAQWGFALVESVNSRPDAQKCHPVWVLDTPVTDYELARECLRALWDKKHGRYPFMDSSIDPTNTIYNADDGEKIHELGNILPWEVFEREVLAPYRERLEQEQPVVPPVGNGGEVDVLRKSRYWQQALQSAADVIRAARDGEKHAELLKASRLLGGYIAGGMGSEGDARALLVAEIRNKGGVKDLSLAEQTIDNGLMYGADAPISYDAKEGERAEWMRLHGRGDVAEQIEAPPLQDGGGAMGALAELKKRQDDWIGSLLKTPRVPEPEWFALLVEIIQKSKMTDLEIDAFIAEVEAPPTLLKRKKTALKNEWRKVRAGQQILGAANVGERPATWPYDARGGRLVLLSEPRGYDSNVVTVNPIADFTASISHEINEEMGSRIFVLNGQAIRGGPFSLEVGAEDFGNDRKLKAMLDGASGSLDPVRAGMAKHLGPAIKLLTKQEECKKIKRYRRTGWADSRFLIPGRSRPGTEIALEEGMAYRVDEGDLGMGLDALDALLQSMGGEITTIPTALAFQAPLARLAGWSSERCAVFIAGRTGSLKTSFAKVLMCLYGKGFIEDVSIQRWDSGATANARMSIASAAQDMPILIDNYKPGTGGGARAFVAFVHSIVEGAEKRRLNRDSSLKKSRPLLCWPLCTGEDVPDGDPASLARILVVTFAWQKGDPNRELAKAHEFSEHLPAVGNAWISWLETDDGQEIVARIASQFPDRRAEWAKVLQSIRKDSVNVLRVASNLATNQLTWEILCEHPTIGTVARKYKDAHAKGLRDNVAVAMAESTAEALEATRYIAALKELLATGKAIVYTKMDDVPGNHERDRIIGWGNSGGIYLLPGIARRAAEQLVSDAFNGVSNLALNKQLDALGLIASKRKGQYTMTKRFGQRVERVLHLNYDVFDLDDGFANDGERIAAEIPL